LSVYYASIFQFIVLFTIQQFYVVQTCTTQPKLFNKIFKEIIRV